MFKFFDAFKQGKDLAHAAGWKNVQLATTGLAVIINVVLQISKMFVDLPDIPEDKVLMVSGGIAAIVNVVLTYTTTEKLGFKENKQ
jgi:hypothetical protein